MDETAATPAVALEHDAPADVAGDGGGVFRAARAREPAARVALVDARLDREPGRARRDVDLLAAAVRAAVPVSSAVVYVAGKTAFTAAAGPGRVVDDPAGRPSLHDAAALAIAVAIYAIGAGIVLPRPHRRSGIVQHSMMGVLLIALAFALWRSRADGVTWLIAGIAVRGVAGSRRGGRVRPAMAAPVAGPAGRARRARRHIPVGELVVRHGRRMADRARLACWRYRSAAAARSKRRITALVLAQDDLRQLADRDPLTGAINRRALRDIFNEVQTSGAMLLFFDLDGFKQINDVHGHAAGDDCLRMFANALKESFRPERSRRSLRRRRVPGRRPRPRHRRPRGRASMTSPSA